MDATDGWKEADGGRGAQDPGDQRRYVRFYVFLTSRSLVATQRQRRYLPVSPQSAALVRRPGNQATRLGDWRDIAGCPRLRTYVTRRMFLSESGSWCGSLR